MRQRRGATLGALALVAALLTMPVPTPAGAAPGEVLILSTTVTGGASSTLAQKFVAAGKTPVVVTPATWSTMTAAQFDSYDAIVLGDPTCSFGTSAVAAAEANASVWSSVVDGNVVVIGTDETFHRYQGGELLMEKAAAFTVAQAGKTGAYISLGCYYHGAPPGTPVPLLAGFGTFTVTGVGCYNKAHIVATHPALSGLTDATLSDWSCSVHEAFDAWPLEFEVLAIAEGAGSTFTAPDGSVGIPYILARGVAVISDISLGPASATNPVGTSHTVTATVVKGDPAPGTPVAGTTVTFTVVAGPHAGTTGTGTTDGSGVATFAYTGTMTGTDTIEATFVDTRGRTQRSNRVVKTWVASGSVCDSEPAPNPSADDIVGTPGPDRIIGTPGNDRIFGLGGNDEIHGMGGDDVIFGGDGDDKLFGGEGNDTLCGGNGKDYLAGGNGNDTLEGGPGNDDLAGEAGDDTLRGNDGDDRLAGGSGVNVLDGGSGNNLCTGPPATVVEC